MTNRFHNLRGWRNTRRLVLAGAVLLGGWFAATASAVELIAHRGGYLAYPENTRAAFRSCSGLVDRVEFDVQPSADGELVVIHDSTVNRTTTGYGAISNVAKLTLAQLKALDAGARFAPAFAGERIPTLAETLQALPPDMPAMLHRKGGSAAAIVQVLRAENAVDRTLVACEALAFLADVHKLEPGLALSAIGDGELTDALLAAFKTNGIGTVSWNKTNLTAAAVARAQAQGFRVHAYPVSTPEIGTYLEMNVDGLLIDNPHTAKAWDPGVPPGNMEMARALAGYWKLDNGLLNMSAVKAENVEGLGNGTLVGFAVQPAWLPAGQSVAGGALHFDGINDCVLLPTNEAMDIGTNAVTLSLWVRLTQLPSALPVDYSCIYGSDIDAYVLYLDRANRELRFKVTDASLKPARPGIPESALQTGVWHHVVGVYNGSAGPLAGQAMVYLDGRLRDVHSGTDLTVGYALTNAVRPGQAAVLGRKGSQANSYFAGDVDEVAVWRRALAPVEVQHIYRAGTNGIPLEKKTMSLWIEGLITDPETSDMELQVRVDHGTLVTNQPLNLRTASKAGGPYQNQMTLEGGRGRRATFRIPPPKSLSPTGQDAGPSAAPGFFQVVLP